MPAAYPALMVAVVFAAVSWVNFSSLAAEVARLPDVRNPQAVLEVATGRRKLASAAWWGFNAEDSTACLQAALDSPATKLVVPCLAKPWIVRPLHVHSNQEICLAPGVVILAKKGEFLGRGDSLITALGQSNLVIRGYGATLRMRKADYQHAPYEKAEWRMGIALRGCRHVRIEGLRVESTGGDGFYLSDGAGFGWCEDITLRDCVAWDNHRQGLSVISAVNLRVEHCLFANTRGTAPEAGIDLEPDTPDNRLVDCLIRDSVFENNNGHAILIYLKQLTRKSQPVSIRFERCLARMSGFARQDPWPQPTNGIQGTAGIAIGEVRDDGPKGSIEFIDCVTQDTAKEAVRVYDKSALGAQVRFLNCAFCRAWTLGSRQQDGPRAPILLDSRAPANTRSFGGIDFQSCSILDQSPGPPLVFQERKGSVGLRDIHGTIILQDAGSSPPVLGANLMNVDLQFVRAR